MTPPPQRAHHCQDFGLRHIGEMRGGAGLRDGGRGVLRGWDVAMCPCMWLCVQSLDVKAKPLTTETPLAYQNRGPHGERFAFVTKIWTLQMASRSPKKIQDLVGLKLFCRTQNLIKFDNSVTTRPKHEEE